MVESWVCGRALMMFVILTRGRRTIVIFSVKLCRRKTSQSQCIECNLRSVRPPFASGSRPFHARRRLFPQGALLILASLPIIAASLSTSRCASSYRGRSALVGFLPTQAAQSRAHMII